MTDAAKLEARLLDAYEQIVGFSFTKKGADAVL